MSNSSLVKYTKLSPNNSGKRTHSIDRITPHCAVGQLSVESLGNIFQKTGDNAVSCNYAIGTDGRVALIVDESQRSWCSSSKTNDQRAVTIECASDKTSPYAFNTTVYNKLVELCVDICKRNGKSKLLWISDKDKALAYEPKDGEMLLTVHRWFANKACPGDWMMARMGDLASKVTAKLSESGSAPATATAPAASSAADTTPKYYRVRKSWKDADSQLGAYSIYENARIKADEAGPRYAVFDWNGKEIYRAAVSTEKEIRFFYPGYSFSGDEPDDRRGGGCIFHDQDGKVLVYDAYMKNSDPAKKMVQYLKENGLMEVDTALVSHAHIDHGGGIVRMFEDAKLAIKNLVCYDPASLKLAGSGSSNARAVQEDKEYLQGIIDLAKKKGAKVRYVKTGDEVAVGEMLWEVCRNQPTKFTDDDQGHGWAYTNDGSINLYNRSIQVHLCGDGGGKAAAQYYDGEESVVESEHHGNGDGKAKVTEVKARGCGLAIECNNEKNGPGSCGFTQYGANRFKEAGIDVWMLNKDIVGVAKGGKLTVTQGSNKKTFDVPFGKVFYRVRKTWADEKSQIGAYTQLDKAKECVDQHPGYTAFDENGNAVYPAAETSGSSGKTQEQTQASSGSGSQTEAKPKTDQEIFIETIGALAKADMAKSGILASVTIAQAILESGWGKSELALNAKNLFGMKCSLSGNTWAGSTWDGKSAYNINTGEYYSGTYTTVRRDFRRYNSWADSVADHSAYLNGAMNGSKLRYSGLKGQKDYRKAVQLIKDGDYATSPTYTTNLCTLIEKYNLTLYDSGTSTTVPATTPAVPATSESISPKILAELMPVIGYGDKGKAVGVAQAILGGLELDSSFGPNTNASTIAFQKKKKLTQDGIIGKNTWTALFTVIKGGADKLPELKYGSSGKAVTALQVMLGGLEKDGSFGPKTEARLKAVTGKTTTTYAVWKSLISAL